MEPQKIIDYVSIKARPRRGQGRGWYRSGAYFQAIVKTVRRHQFVLAFGEEEGSKLHYNWMKDCQRRGGECTVGLKGAGGGKGRSITCS